MKTPYPITTTQRALIVQQAQRVQQAQQQLNGIYTVILAGHDVTNGNVVEVDDTSIWVEMPDVHEEQPA